MAKIIITNDNNEEIQVEGRMTFKVSKAIKEDGTDTMICLGQLATHKYFEEITKIETDRFILENVEVTDETFGTNDFNILYEFEVHNYGWTIKEGYLSEETIKRIELEEYKDDEGNNYIAMERGDK